MDELRGSGTSPRPRCRLSASSAVGGWGLVGAVGLRCESRCLAETVSDKGTSGEEAPCGWVTFRESASLVLRASPVSWGQLFIKGIVDKRRLPYQEHLPV